MPMGLWDQERCLDLTWSTRTATPDFWRWLGCDDQSSDLEKCNLAIFLVLLRKTKPITSTIRKGPLRQMDEGKRFIYRTDKG